MNAREPLSARSGAPGARLPPRPGARTRAGRPARRRQRGSIATLAVVALVVAVAALGVLDLANVYLARRALQNVADLAALAAVQQMDDACRQPLLTATANAASNGFTAQGASKTLTVVCGRWDASGSGGAMAFVPNGASPLNGAMVTVTEQVPYFFVGPARTLQASATAKATVVGSFTLATSLLQVNLLNGLLGSLLGTNVNLTAVSWSGLANANVRLLDLANVATNAGTVSGLLDTSVSVNGLAQLMISALQKGGSAVYTNLDASVAGLQAIASASALSNVQIPVGATSSTPGLLSLGLANPDSAANVQVNALQALIVGAEIAQQGRSPVAANVDLSNVPGLSSLIPLGLKLSVNVLSPPSIAIGEPGGDPGPPPVWRTAAHNAQVTVRLDLGLPDVGIPGLLDVSVNVPLFVEAAYATAGFASATCAPTAAQSRSVIDVDTGVANLCLGSPPTGSAPLTAGQCGGTPAQIASVSVLGMGLVGVTSSLSVQLAAPATYQLTFDGNGNLLSNSQTGSTGSSVNTNQVGGALGNALTSLSTQLGNNQGQATGQPVLNVTVGTLPIGYGLGWLAGVLASLLSPILSTLDTVLLGPLLQLLGVQLGVASVTDAPLGCGVAQLVQ